MPNPIRGLLIDGECRAHAFSTATWVEFAKQAMLEIQRRNHLTELRAYEKIFASTGTFLEAHHITDLRVRFQSGDLARYDMEQGRS